MQEVGATDDAKAYIFQLDLLGHLPGFFVITFFTAAAAGGFGAVTDPLRPDAPAGLPWTVGLSLSSSASRWARKSPTPTSSA